MGSGFSIFGATNFFDLAAISVSALLSILYLYRRVYFTRQGKIFFAMALGNIVTGAASIAMSSIIPNPGMAVWLKYLVYIIETSSMVFHVTCYFFYTFTISKGQDTAARPRWAWGIPLSATFVLLIIVTTPFSHLFVYLSNYTVMEPGPLFMITPIFAAVVFALVIFLNLTSQGALTGSQRIILWGNVIVLMLILVIRIFNSSISFDAFGDCLVIILLFAVMENPSFYYHDVGFCYNNNAFYHVANQFAAGRRKWVVFVGIEEREYLSRLMSRDKSVEVYKSFCKQVGAIYKHEMVFFLGDSTFAMYVDSEPEKVAGVLVDTYFNCGHDDELGMSLTPYACYYSCDNAESADDVRKALDVFIRRKKSSTTLKRVSQIMPGEVDRRNREAAVVAAIRNALDNDAIQVFYQPIYFGRSGKFEACEALIRLRDRELGNISPTEFLPLAEENGLIIPIGEAVITKVCKFIKAYDLRKMGISFVEVNISVLQCMQYEMADRIIAIMSEYEVEPGMINLEINESSFKTDKEMVAKNITKLRSYGVSFSLDDFGSGFSNAEYITSIPVMFVNLAIRLVTSAMEDRNSLIILRNYISLIKDMRYGCIAKGVESSEMVDTMRDLGCDAFQGYFYSRAMEQEDFVSFITNR